jgi:hypothetical protein
MSEEHCKEKMVQTVSVKNRTLYHNYRPRQIRFIKLYADLLRLTVQTVHIKDI